MFPRQNCNESNFINQILYFPSTYFLEIYQTINCQSVNFLKVACYTTASSSLTQHQFANTDRDNVSIFYFQQRFMWLAAGTSLTIQCRVEIRVRITVQLYIYSYILNFNMVYGQSKSLPRIAHESLTSTSDNSNDIVMHICCSLWVRMCMSDREGKR